MLTFRSSVFTLTKKARFVLSLILAGSSVQPLDGSDNAAVTVIDAVALTFSTELHLAKTNLEILMKR